MLARNTSESRPSSLSSWSSGPALLCAVIFFGCVVLIWPHLESGLTDDWSTVRTAQLLAQTGHIHYNGWEAAILGWPLYVAALFIKLFGPSFTVIRSTTILEAIATVILVQRTFVRVGISQWNASMGVLTLALSPIFFVASVTFMTDVPGIIAVVLCFYACVRALQAATSRAAASWVCFAAASNALLGTSRQIAWLGILLMVPCTLWILRRKRGVVLSGIIACALSLVFCIALVHWFNRQPYILPAPLFPARFDNAAAVKLIAALPRTVLDFVLFLLPVALAFLPSLRRLDRRGSLVLGGAAVLLGIIAAWQHSQHQLKMWLAPFLLFQVVHPQSAENTFTMTQMPIKGPAPLPLGEDFRIGLTIVVLLGFFALLAAFSGRPVRTQGAAEAALSWRDLLLLTVPFSLAYGAFLLLRGSYNFVYDRYFLLILPLVLALLLRFFQSGVRQRLPAFCTLLLLLMGGYSVLTLHDVFACYRASLEACNEVRAAGLPRTAIDGGWEYNHYTQVLTGGVIYQAGMRMPDGSVLPDLNSGIQTVCSMEVREWTPDVKPLYAVAYPTSPCARVPGFPPIHFRTWLPPFHRTASIVRYVASGPVPGGS